MRKITSSTQQEFQLKNVQDALDISYFNKLILKGVFWFHLLFSVIFVFLGTHYVLINLLMSITCGVSVMSKEDRLTSDTEAILAAFTVGTWNFVATQVFKL